VCERCGSRILLSLSLPFSPPPPPPRLSFSLFHSLSLSPSPPPPFSPFSPPSPPSLSKTLYLSARERERVKERERERERARDFTVTHLCSPLTLLDTPGQGQRACECDGRIRTDQSHRTGSSASASPQQRDRNTGRSAPPQAASEQERCGGKKIGMVLD